MGICYVCEKDMDRLWVVLYAERPKDDRLYELCDVCFKRFKYRMRNKPQLLELNKKLLKQSLPKITLDEKTSGKTTGKKGSK